MFEDVGLQPPEHVGTQHIVQLLDLVFLGDVGKLFQEDLQFAARWNQSQFVEWTKTAGSHCNQVGAISASIVVILQMIPLMFF